MDEPSGESLHRVYLALNELSNRIAVVESVLFRQSGDRSMSRWGRTRTTPPPEPDSRVRSSTSATVISTSTRLKLPGERWLVQGARQCAHRGFVAHPDGINETVDPDEVKQLIAGLPVRIPDPPYGADPDLGFDRRVIDPGAE